MAKVELRRSRLSDAKRYYEILSNPNFIYFAFTPKSVEEEVKYIKDARVRSKQGREDGFAVLYGDKHVGGCGIKIDQYRKHVGEIGYFIAEEYWGKGIASKAVKMVERFAAKKHGTKRFEILALPKNKASIKVALKCGYKKEGLLKKKLPSPTGKGQVDAYIYGKVK